MISTVIFSDKCSHILW